ncbi:hypothetical protein DFP72DRAFT_852004 [Ephemerocybe angulata]|uniref:Uncharacterized protein n=1 Tax=Ephemerocybe angulata TaxID=980116 RepID=A0A8H6HQM7_9AGAR|nr:hypothetical protein DFP72DRAFT_852004 [Tulosesus angulatus]
MCRGGTIRRAYARPDCGTAQSGHDARRREDIKTPSKDGVLVEVTLAATRSSHRFPFELIIIAARYCVARILRTYVNATLHQPEIRCFVTFFPFRHPQATLTPLSPSLNGARRRRRRRLPSTPQATVTIASALIQPLEKHPTVANTSSVHHPTSPTFEAPFAAVYVVVLGLLYVVEDNGWRTAFGLAEDAALMLRRRDLGVAPFAGTSCGDVLEKGDKID